MGLITNYSQLATSKEREIVLSIIEEGLQAIQPEHILKTSFVKNGTTLHIQDEEIELTSYKRIFLLGIGKGSATISAIIADILTDTITKGFVIDTIPFTFSNPTISYTQGTHPLPSETNITFTKQVLDTLSGLTPQDLVLIVICGGGSALFELPFTLSLSELEKLFQLLLHSGATISEMNTIRKHVSQVKGGGLAKHLYPAKVVSMLFSDVPGNDLSVIASGPTVKDTTTSDDAFHILETYDIPQQLPITKEQLTTLPQDNTYFSSVSNILMLTNTTCLSAMQKKASSLGLRTTIESTSLQGNAKDVGTMLLQRVKKGEILLAGGETTVKVQGKGKGGRNQTVVLASLPFLTDNTIIASFDSDGKDMTHFAGALGDHLTTEKAQAQGLDIIAFTQDDDSTTFFEKVEDGIETGPLGSNVSDIMVVYKP